MPSTSAILNSALRRTVSPVLREAGFQHVDARNAWLWQKDCIWVFNIRAVGSYFSRVTRWPPGSVGAVLGVYYTFIPEFDSIKVDSEGRLRPQYHMCHMQWHLNRKLDQSRYLRRLSKNEGTRTDLWWVDPAGKTAPEVAGDIADALLHQGLPWFKQVSNLRKALPIVEEHHDCFTKFSLAALIARHSGRTRLWKKYDQLAETEAKRIGHPLDRRQWFISGLML